MPPSVKRETKRNKRKNVCSTLTRRTIYLSHVSVERRIVYRSRRRRQRNGDASDTNERSVVSSELLSVWFFLNRSFLRSATEVLKDKRDQRANLLGSIRPGRLGFVCVALRLVVLSLVEPVDQRLDDELDRHFVAVLHVLRVPVLQGSLHGF